MRSGVCGVVTHTKYRVFSSYFNKFINLLKGEIMSKINKLGKSAFVIAILSLVLVAVLTFGGTYAYFSAKTKEAVTDDITLGTLKLDEGNFASNTIFNDLTIAQPNQKLFGGSGKSFTVKTTADTNISYYTRVKFTITVEAAAGAAHKNISGDDLGHTEGAKDNLNAIDILIITIANDADNAAETNKIWGRGAVQAVADIDASAASSYYYYKLQPTTIEQTNNDEHTETFTVSNLQVKPIIGVDYCTYWMGAKISVSITFEVLQADFLNDGVTAGAEFESGTAAEAAWTTALTGVEG